MNTTSRYLRMIRRLNGVGFVVAVLGSLAYGTLDVIGGVVLGGLISVINFELLARLSAGALNSQGKPGSVAAKVLIKFTVLMLLVTGLLIAVPMSAIAFAIGFSLPFVSIGIGGVFTLFSGDTPDPESTDA